MTDQTHTARGLPPQAILYEDNHLLIVNKRAGEPVQADPSGDPSLEDRAKQYIKASRRKQGEAFLGVPHRLDRPVSGAVIFAKTSKALTRLNAMFKEGRVTKKILGNRQKPPSQRRGHAYTLPCAPPRQQQNARPHTSPAPLQRSAPALQNYWQERALFFAGDNAVHGAASSNSLPDEQNWQPHQRRPQIWLSAFQSCGQHLASRRICGICAPCGRAAHTHCRPRAKR